MVDAVHVWNLLMRLRMACAPPDQEAEEDADEEEAKLQGSGRGNDNVGGAALPAKLPKSKRGLFLDLFVILPVLQVRVHGLSK
jgi:hypothetical protein